MRSPPPLGWLYVLACAVVVVGGAARFQALGGQNFDVREIAHINAVDRLWHSAAAWPTAVTDDSPMPVPYVVTRLALGYGYAENTLRFPNAVEGTATLPVVWLLGRALF